MQILGFEITRVRKEIPRTTGVVSGGWWSRIFDSTSGAWQQHVEVDRESVLAQSTVYSCVTLIAADIGKLRPKLVRLDDGIWSETTSPSFSPVLRKPNGYQNRIKFIEQWIISKLLHGNTYVLKVRDNRGVVVGLYILNPCSVKVLVAPNGDVYYTLSQDNLSGLETEVTVPASEIIHDTMVALYHPLVGVSPIFACGVAATQALAIQSNSTKLFQNGSRPGGVLTAPGEIKQETADRLKAAWDANYGGDNYGKTAVLGDGLKYEPTVMNATDAQLIEQLKWSAEQVCACFHMPAYMVGVGAPPPTGSSETEVLRYYSQCLQSLIESLELCLDEGLGLTEPKKQENGAPVQYGIELDLDGLIRMDSKTQVETLAAEVKGSLATIDEARAARGRPSVKGGKTIWMQQQNYSLDALMERDANDPFAKPPPPSPEAPAPDNAKDFAAIQKQMDGVAELVRGLPAPIDVAQVVKDTVAAMQPVTPAPNPEPVDHTAAFVAALNQQFHEAA